MPAVAAGARLFVAGHDPERQGRLVYRGRVGEAVSAGDARDGPSARHRQRTGRRPRRRGAARSPPLRGPDRLRRERDARRPRSSAPRQEPRAAGGRPARGGPTRRVATAGAGTRRGHDGRGRARAGGPSRGGARAARPQRSGASPARSAGNRSSASAIRGPYQLRSLPSTRWTRPVRTAGTSAIGAKSAAVNRPEPVGLIRQQDHIRRGRAHLLEGHRRVASRAVAEDVVGATGLQHVVDIGVTVDRHVRPAPDGAEDAGAGPVGRAGKCLRPRRLEGPGEVVGDVLHSGQGAELPDEPDALRHGPRERDPHRHPVRPEGVHDVAPVLLHVRHDEVRRQGADSGEVGVLLASDLRRPRHPVAGLGTEDRDTDDPVVEPEGEQELRDARDERHDAQRSSGHGDERPARIPPRRAQASLASHGAPRRPPPACREPDAESSLTAGR